MSTKTIYTDGPMGEVEVIEDFLPSPSDLKFQEGTVEVKVALSQSSFKLLQRHAEDRRLSFQKMLSRLLDDYALQQAR